jgi:hypothetical protein
MTLRPGRGLRPSAVRRLLAALRTLSIPACAPLALFGLIAGTLCVAAGWWTALPAALPGDELFNAQRVAGFTLRALTGWPQPPDVPLMPWLVIWGIGIDLSALLVLFAGTALRLLRPTIDAQLARHAADIRMVVLGDDAAAVVAAEPTSHTNVLLSSSQIKSRTLHGLRVRLDPEFLETSLPLIAPHATELLALGVDSTANIELVRRTLELRRESVPAAELDRLWIRIDPRELRTSLGREEFPEFAQAARETRLISLPEARCRRLLQDQPPNKVRIVHGGCRAAIVIIGLGETGLELLRRLCAQAQSPSNDSLVVVLVDTEAPATARELLELWPGLGLVVEFVPLALEPRLPQSAIALFRHLHAQDLIPTALYVALEDTALCSAWEHEIGLAVRLAGRESPLVLSTSRDEAIDRSLLAEEEEVELLQRALHEEYLRELCGTAVKPSNVDWCRLSFDYREDNRSLAEHVSSKALDLDLSIAPSRQTQALSLGDEMIEPLAAAEHRRWIASRAIAGWRLGETLSETERTHPSMVPWANLSEADRERTRAAIRRMPTVVHAAGLSFQRLITTSVPRTVLTESSVEAILAEASHRANAAAGCSHLIVPVEDARSFVLAQRLIDSCSSAVSLVVAQPLIGLAIAAGQPPEKAMQLARRARTLWIVRPDTFASLLARWPCLTLGATA